MTESLPLIGLTGHKGAGKDTVAAILREAHGYQRKAWADALKWETYEAFGLLLLTGLWSQRYGEHGHDYLVSTSFDAWLAFIDQHKHDSPDSEYGWIRPMLQFWGTEYRRQLCGDDYWTKQLELGPGVVVTDCRFPNEAAAVLEAGGALWKIERPGYTGDGHASETLIDHLPETLTILNDSTVDDLRRSVLVALELTKGLMRGLESE